MFPADYDGVVADVPIVSFSTLMLAPELIRIRERPRANWVTRAKVNAISAEYKDGLLTVRLPQREEAKPKTIAIN